MTNKRNIGVLPMNDNYTFISIEHGDTLNGCTCENCGRPISNIVTLKNSKNITFVVGTECSKTLESGEFNNYFEMQDQIKKYNNFLSAIAKIKKLVTSGNYTILYCNMGLYFYAFNNVKNWHSNYYFCDRQVYNDYALKFKEVIFELYNDKITLADGKELPKKEDFYIANLIKEAHDRNA